MCLNWVTEKFETPVAEERVAYKVFEVDEGRLRFAHQRLDDSAVVRRGRWLKAAVEAIWDRRGVGYDSGFHCFADKAEAEGAREHHYGGAGHVVVEVKVRGVRTVGTQRLLVREWEILDHGYGELAVLVADEMLVPAEGKAEV